MSDFLSRMAARALGVTDPVQPLVGSRYGDGAAPAGLGEQSAGLDAAQPAAPSRSIAAPVPGAPRNVASSPAPRTVQSVEAPQSPAPDAAEAAPRADDRGAADTLLLPVSADASSTLAPRVEPFADGLNEVAAETVGPEMPGRAAAPISSRPAEGSTLPLSPVDAPVVQRYAASSSSPPLSTTGGSNAVAGVRGDSSGSDPVVSGFAPSLGFETVDSFVDAPPRPASPPPERVGTSRESTPITPREEPPTDTRARATRGSAGPASTEPSPAGGVESAGDVQADGLLMPPVNESAERRSSSARVNDGNGFPGEVVDEIAATSPASRTSTAASPASAARSPNPAGENGPSNRDAVGTRFGDRRPSVETVRSSPRAPITTSASAADARDGLLMPHVDGDGALGLSASTGSTPDGELREVAERVEAVARRASTDVPQFTASADSIRPVPRGAESERASAGSRGATTSAPALRPLVEQHDVARQTVGPMETVASGEVADGDASGSRSTALARTRRGEPIAVRTRTAERDGRRARPEAAEERPTIRISIGRIEVRAVHPPAPVVPQPAPQPTGWRAPVMTLEQYLKGGAGR